MEHWKVKCSTAAWRMHAVKNIIDPFIEIRSCEALFISIIKESFELSRAMAKKWASFHVRSIWSDGWIRFEMPQATKSEVPISWARDCLWAQIRPMRTFLSCDSKLNLRLVKIKRKKRKNQIKKPQLDHEHTGRERNGGEKWSIPKAEKTKKSEQLFKFDFAEIETFF